MQVTEIPGLSRNGSLSFWKPRAPTLIPWTYSPSAGGQKPFENITLARTAAQAQRPPQRTPAEGQLEQVMIPGPQGTILPHEPVIKSQTGTGFHASSQLVFLALGAGWRFRASDGHDG